MILLALHPDLEARAQARLDKEGWRDLETLITQLLTKYAYYRDAAGGGHARAKALTPTQRSRSAKAAALARWAAATPEERRASSQRANAASHAPRRAAAALARMLTMPAKRVPGWPLEDWDEEEP